MGDTMSRNGDDKRVYMRPTPQGNYRVTRTQNTLEVVPGDVINREKVEWLMKEGIKTIIDPPERAQP
jgi:hypothetical protein